MTDSDSNIVYQARLHWILFFWPTVLLCLGFYIDFFYREIQTLGLIFMGLGILWEGITWVTYHFSSITIKKTHMILHTGMFVRETVDIPFSKIESIDIRRTLPGSLLKYGSLMIKGTGGSRNIVPYLDKPLICRRYIEQLMHDI